VTYAEVVFERWGVSVSSRLARPRTIAQHVRLPVLVCLCSTALALAACGGSHSLVRKTRPSTTTEHKATLPQVSKLAPAPAAAEKVIASLKNFPAAWTGTAPKSHEALSAAKSMEMLAYCLRVSPPASLPAISDSYSLSSGAQTASSTSFNVQPSESMQAEVWIWSSAALASRFFAALHSPVAPGCLTKASGGDTSSPSSSVSSLSLHKAAVHGLDAPAVGFSLTYGGSTSKPSQKSGSSNSLAPTGTLPISLPKIQLRVIYVSLGKVLIASDWAAIQLPFPSSVEVAALRSMITAAKSFQ